MFQLIYKSQKIIAISDTHGQHRMLNIPTSDILIHCGDACTDGNLEQLKDFFSWFSEQDSKYKIFIAGNHDLPFDLEPNYAQNLIPKNVIYLENNSKKIKDITFHSVAARPWLHEMPELKTCDILITHGSAFSILDNDLGCKTLKYYIEKTKPHYFLFGHIHQQSGMQQKLGKTNCINTCNH